MWRQLRCAAREAFAGGRDIDSRRVLVIADAPPSGDEPAARIRAAAGEDAQLDVVAPVLAAHATAAPHAELVDAHRRLEATLAWAHRHGFAASGTIGGEDPETAIADALRRSGAESVLFVSGGEAERTRPQDRARRRADADLAVPVLYLQA